MLAESTVSQTAMQVPLRWSGGPAQAAPGAGGAHVWSRVDRPVRPWYVRAVSGDPTHTDPDKYKLVFENERIRVLEYRDKPGDRTSPHRHPDSVMYTLSSFSRRLIHGDQQRDVQMEAGRVNWLAAQEHSGENIGTTDTHVLFVELKEPRPRSSASTAELGPARAP